MRLGTPPDITLFYTGDGGRMPIVLRNKGPCVCPRVAGRKRLRDCCLMSDGRIIVVDPSPRPSSTSTSRSLTGCYASSLGDCSERLSREHYFTEGVVRLFPNADRLTVIGPPGGRRGHRPRKLSAGQFHERILCGRHNSILSPIDDTAIWFFGGIAKALERPRTDEPLRYVNGLAFERWLLKVTCGVLAAQGLPVAEQWLRVLFCNQPMPHPWGLYIYVHVGSFAVEEAGMHFGVSHDPTAATIGTEVRFDRFRFVLVVGDRPPHRPGDTGASAVHRPRSLTFEYPTGPDYVCGFTWPPFSGTPVSVRLKADK
jgi:hypothetical protein